jgi:hypothetical protein
MKIIINPREFSGDTSWESKMEGVVLVEKEDQIDPLWKLLCEQDDYWEDYKDLIKVAPKTIDSVADIKRMCEYCGKTDIYNVEEIRSKIPFIIFQYRDCY